MGESTSGQDLEGNIALQAELPGSIHNAHAPTADDLDQLVIAQTPGQRLRILHGSLQIEARNLGAKGGCHQAARAMTTQDAPGQGLAAALAGTRW